MTRKAILVLAAALAIAVVAAIAKTGAGREPEAPEPLVLMPSLQQRGSVSSVKLDVEGVGHARGAEDAPVTVVEFSDFGCPFCGTFALGTYPVLEEEFVATGAVRWVYVPIVMGIFPNGDGAARAAECAAEQGEDAFWAMHSVLYERQTGWKSASDPAPMFARYAAEIGLDADAFGSCYAENRGRGRIEAGNALAARAFVRATPTFFVNGRRVQGALPLEYFRAILEEAGR